MTSAKSFSAERNKGKLDLSVGPTVIEGVHQGLGLWIFWIRWTLDVPHGNDTRAMIGCHLDLVAEVADDLDATWTKTDEVEVGWPPHQQRAKQERKRGTEAWPASSSTAANASGGELTPGKWQNGLLGVRGSSCTRWLSRSGKGLPAAATSAAVNSTVAADLAIEGCPRETRGSTVMAKTRGASQNKGGGRRSRESAARQGLPETEKNRGNGISVAEGKGERRELTEEDMERIVTRKERRRISPERRSTKWPAIGFSDEDDNSERGSSGQRGCKHGVAHAIADPKAKTALPDMHGRRSKSSAEKLRASSVFRRLRRNQEEPGAESLGFWRRRTTHTN